LLSKKIFCKDFLTSSLGLTDVDILPAGGRFIRRPADSNKGQEQGGKNRGGASFSSN